MQEDLAQLISNIREEQRLAAAQHRTLCSKDLADRRESCRALGPLKIVHIDHEKGLILFDPPEEDFSLFSYDQPLRLSRDSPLTDYIDVHFKGLEQKYFAVFSKNTHDLSLRHTSGWTLDEDLIDLSHHLIETVEELANSEHGRDTVYPALFRDLPPILDNEIYSDTLDSLESNVDLEKPLNSSQEDAIATAMAQQCHLIQGPPGTGKTQVLAKVVEQLVEQNKRIFVTGFTHRSINNALRKIYDVIGDHCPIVKVSRFASLEGDQPFDSVEYLRDVSFDLENGPFIIAGTPFSLRTKRLPDLQFDHALCDETSQMSIPLAMMLMLRADHWTFFGDHAQLPPVSLLHSDPLDASVFKRLADRCEPSLLSVTYRMNKQLTLWPSDKFYSGELTAHSDHRFCPLGDMNSLLHPERSLHRVVSYETGSLSKNDDECDRICELIDALLHSGHKPSTIGVVTPFRLQAAIIRRRLSKHKDAQHITVDTVDRFQGQEREIIFYSFCASDPLFIAKIENFLFQQHRLNVAVTRARSKVIIFHSQEIYDHCLTRAKDGSEPASLFLSLMDQCDAPDPSILAPSNGHFLS